MHNRLFEAKLISVDSASTPDVYDRSVSFYPSDDFVVSRDSDGKSLSCYGDLAWDRTPYGTNKDGLWLYFDYWRGRNQAPDLELALKQLTPERVERTRTTRWLMFILIYLRPGNGLANSTLNNYCGLLCKLGSFAETNAISVTTVLSSATYLVDFSTRAPNHAKYLVSLLCLLKTLSSELTGLEVASKVVISEIREIGRAYREQSLQTPPIPTRIYSHILSSLEEEIEDFGIILPQLLRLLTDCTRDRLLGRDSRMRSVLGVPDEPVRSNFREVLEEYGLTEFWRRKGYNMGFYSLSAVLTEIMGVCYLQIQAFSGMRFNEVYALPHFCLHSVTANGGTHYIVSGRVTKLTGGKIKRVRWVTSHNGQRAILMAQKISRTIYELANDLPEESNDRINSHFLFVAPTYCLANPRHRKNKQPTLDFTVRAFDRIRKQLSRPITEDDLKELELIDPDRDWRNEANFQLGTAWTLRTHQLRRSLALYCQASGLVSLPSLKRQLQHITRAMSQYYAKGSHFAVNFISSGEGKERHFGKEWQETTAESEYLGHKVNVEMASSSELSGTYALWYDRNIRQKQVVLDRRVTLKEFRQGKRAYRETFAGGCVKVGPCDVPLTDPMNLKCLLNKCKHQVIKIPKFEKLIRIQVRAVKELEDKDSELPETKIERDLLTLMQDKLRAIVSERSSS